MVFHKYDLKILLKKNLFSINQISFFYRPTVGPVLIDGVEPCFSSQLKLADESSDHPEHSLPSSKLQSNGDCGASVV